MNLGSVDLRGLFGLAGKLPGSGAGIIGGLPVGGLPGSGAGIISGLLGGTGMGSSGFGGGQLGGGGAFGGGGGQFGGGGVGMIYQQPAPYGQAPQSDPLKKGANAGSSAKRPTRAQSLGTKDLLLGLVPTLLGGGHGADYLASYLSSKMQGSENQYQDKLAKFLRDQQTAALNSTIGGFGGMGMGGSGFGGGTIGGGGSGWGDARDLLNWGSIGEIGRAHV